MWCDTIQHSIYCLENFPPKILNVAVVQSVLNRQQSAASIVQWIDK